MLDHNGMLLQELVYSKEDLGVLAVSIVPNPAIEKNFVNFGKLNFAIPDKYFYTLKPEYTGEPMLLETSHSLCKKYAKGDSVGYTMNTINGWSRYTQYKGWGFTDTAKSLFDSVDTTGIDLGLCMYGCRHMLKKKSMFHSNFSFQYEFKKIDSKQKRIKGPIMIANKPILRPPEELDKVHWGYVWFSNETLENLQKSYGLNSTSTFLHQVDISKNMIMTKTWIDKTNPKNWEWWAEYAVLSDFVWEQIQDNQVRGFSVEINCSPKINIDKKIK